MSLTLHDKSYYNGCKLYTAISAETRFTMWKRIESPVQYACQLAVERPTVLSTLCGAGRIKGRPSRAQSEQHPHRLLSQPTHSSTSTHMALLTRKIGSTNVSALGFGAMGIAAFYATAISEAERFKVHNNSPSKPSCTVLSSATTNNLS